jgi:TRAP-type mannitol/chloroaromatic compound transport system permease small subunit
VVRPRVAKTISVVTAGLAGAALVIELTVSHGLADLFWFLFAVLLVIASYALRHHARTLSIYQSHDQAGGDDTSRGDAKR